MAFSFKDRCALGDWDEGTICLFPPFPASSLPLLLSFLSTASRKARTKKLLCCPIPALALCRLLKRAHRRPPPLPSTQHTPSASSRGPRIHHHIYVLLLGVGVRDGAAGGGRYLVWCKYVPGTSWFSTHFSPFAHSLYAAPKIRLFDFGLVGWFSERGDTYARQATSCFSRVIQSWYQQAGKGER